MARSDIHPSLCVYHSDREEQLFGDPSYRRETRKLDFPELYSACRDLSTAAGVNRALAQVFRLLAQRRISRQEAATFAKLGHLLLQSIRAARAEALDTDADAPPEREISSPASPHYESTLPSQDQRGAASSYFPASMNSSVPAIAPSPESPAEPVAMSNSRKISTSAPSTRNSTEISTYKNAELYPHQNQHLQNNERGSERQILVAP